MWLGQEENQRKNKRPAVRVSRFKISEEPFSRIKNALGRIQEKA